MKQNYTMPSYCEKKAPPKENITLSESILLSRGKDYYKFAVNRSKFIIMH